MASSFEVSVDIAAPPDAVWAVLADTSATPNWYPMYLSCVVEGDLCRARRRDGVEIVERLLERDDARRFRSYSLISGVPLRSHHASFEVIESGSGSRVIWRTRGEYEDPTLDIESRLSGRQAEALIGLKEFVERRTHPTRAGGVHETST